MLGLNEEAAQRLPAEMAKIRALVRRATQRGTLSSANRHIENNISSIAPLPGIPFLQSVFTPLFGAFFHPLVYFISPVPCIRYLRRISHELREVEPLIRTAVDHPLL